MSAIATSRKTKSAQLTVEETVIPVTWLMISATIPAELAAFLESRTPGPAKCWGKDVFCFYSSAAFSVIHCPVDGPFDRESEEKVKHYFPAQVSRWENLRGYKAATFRFLMKPPMWDDIQKIAKITGHSESALIRAALWERHRGIVLFEKTREIMVTVEADTYQRTEALLPSAFPGKTIQEVLQRRTDEWVANLEMAHGSR